MPITTDSLNKNLYQLLKVRGFDPVPKDSDGETTPVPDEADVFKFTFKRNDKPYGTAWVTIDSNQKLVVYYKDEINNADAIDEDNDPGNYDDSWTGFLKNLKMWAQRRQLGFDLENQDHLASDMAQRAHMKKKEQIAEGYYPMGKQASYSDAIPTVKIVLQHTRQIQEGEQRFRNIARIFLENTQGERILCPYNRPGLAQVYARHLAEGGKPNDERWNHITGLCEEYSKMAGFARAVKNGQFNESAQKLVEAGVNHFLSLRESLGKMRGHRGYNAYFESWTPTLMETEGDESTNINELFVQETLDPRIESVMPILSKLSKNLGEMKEVNELAEWADNVTEDEGRQALNPVGVPESEEGVAEAAKWRRDDLEGKTWRDSDWDDGFLAPDKIKLDRDGNDVDDFGDELTSRPGAWRGKADMAKRMTKKGVPTKSELGFQNNLKMRIKMKKKEGGLSGPKGALPEQGVAEGYSGRKNDDGTWSVYKDGQKVPDVGVFKNRELAKAWIASVWLKDRKDRNKQQGVAEGNLTEFAPGDSGEDRTYEYEVYQCDPNDQFNWIGGPLYKTDDLGKAHSIAYTLHKKHPNKAFMVWQENTQGSRGRYGPKDSDKDLGEQGVAEGEIEDAEKAHQKISTPAALRKAKGGDWKVTSKDIETSRARTGTSPEGLAAIKKLAGVSDHMTSTPIPGLGEDKGKIVVINPEAQQEMLDWLESEGFDAPEPTTDEKGNLVYDFSDMDHSAYVYASDFDIGSQEADDDLAEDLDANQKRVGQLGPTEKVKNNNIGKLVGANESVEHDPLKDMLKLLGR